VKEIGGYFGFEQLICNEYYKELVRLNTARNALLYLIKSKEIKKVYIPNYLCDSVSDMLQRNSYEFEYYNVNSEFLPVFNEKLNENEFLYIVNYYGQLTNGEILILKEKYKQIIVDNTHAFFQKPLYAVDTIYSCRKFFGVPDGAYLSTDRKINAELEIDISKERMKHLLGRFEGSASDYYGNFQEVDELFNNEPLKRMSNLTHNLLGAIDYDRVLQIRNENYSYLESKLKGKNILKLEAPDGAFAYPFYIENGIEIRKNLAEKNIYIPTLWPNVLRDVLEESVESQYAANILPLPCDQRYGIDDMQYIIEVVLGERLNV